MLRSILFIVIAYTAVSCRGDSGPTPAPEIAPSCNNLHYDWKRDNAADLSRIEGVIESCSEDAYRSNDALGMAIDIARGAPELCPDVWRVYGRVVPSQNLDYLLLSTQLHYACDPDTAIERPMSLLVRAISAEVFGADAPGMETFVRHSQEALLFRWARDERRLLQSLRDGTAELCVSDEVLSRAVRASGHMAPSNFNPAAILGLWTRQPRESVDPQTLGCLRRAAHEIARQAPEFDAPMDRDLMQIVGWISELGDQTPESWE